MSGLLWAVIAGPLLAGLAWLAAARLETGSPKRTRVLGSALLAVVVLTVLGLVALLPWAGSDLALSIKWLPSAGPMAIGLGATGLYVALATTGGCALALWSESALWSERGSWGSCPGKMSRMGALTLLSVAAAQVAFLAEHFLARYVALEMVALCVALAPLVELYAAHDGHTNNGSATGGHLSRLVYLVLRLGDVGLLAAILLLWSAGGTLDIASALEAGQTLDAVHLTWVVGGFCLAVWVKVGGWPLHLWQQVGGRLSQFSRSWLYASLMPNLGLYLLYRVTPLVAHVGSVQGTIYWVGAAGAALAAILALATARSSLRSSLVLLGAALGGLAFVLAASGLKTAVWMTALVLTPLRLLFYLAQDLAQTDRASPGHTTSRRGLVAVGLFALGGLALTAYCLLCTWWVRQAGMPPAARLVAEFAAAAIGIWAGYSAWLIRRSLAQSETVAQDIASSRRPTSRAVCVIVLGVVVLAGGLLFKPLARHLAGVAHSKPLPLPTVLGLVRYVATMPAFWIAIALAAVARRLGLHLPRPLPDVSKSPASTFQAPGSPALNLEEGLSQAAQILSAVVEVNIQERILGGIVRAVLGGARATRRVVEHQVLDGAIRWTSSAAIGSGRLAYRVLEQGGLEGLLRGTVRGALSAGRWMQRWHTGRLRRNLLWIAASLILTIVVLTLYGW